MGRVYDGPGDLIGNNAGRNAARYLARWEQSNGTLALRRGVPGASVEIATDGAITAGAARWRSNSSGIHTAQVHKAPRFIRLCNG